MGYDRAKTVELMHRLDVDREVWSEVPHGAEGRGHGAGLERGSAPAIDCGPVRRGKFVPVERGVGLCNDGPRVRVVGRFAGEVPGVEFAKAASKSSGSNMTCAAILLVGVDLDDVKQLGVEVAQAA